VGAGRFESLLPESKVRPDKKEKDTTIANTFMKNVKHLTSETWTPHLINNFNKDRLIYFYSSETINFHQRVVAHQISLMNSYLESLHYLGSKVELFAMDVHVEGFPNHKNVQISGSPPNDATGQYMDSEGKNKKSLPALYFFAAGEDAEAEALRWQGGAITTHKLLNWLRSKATNSLPKIQHEHTHFAYKNKDVTYIGERAIDQKEFSEKCRNEGLMAVNSYEHDEL
jgi:hypothetical protein